MRLNRYGRSPWERRALNIPVAVAAILLFCLSSAKAESETWSDTVEYDLQVAGSYNYSSVVIFTSNIANIVTDINGIRSSETVNSFNDNVGLILFNQDTGILNSQANVQSHVLGGLDSVGIAELATVGAHLSVANTTTTQGGVRTNLISGSFQRTSGVVTVNQSAGVLNSQVNAFQFGTALASGPVALTSIDETSLANIKADNVGSDNQTTSKRDVITGNSFDQFSGSAQITQSSGDQNVIRNSTNITFSVRTLQ